MSKPSHTIVDMAEVWVELTPRHLHRAIRRIQKNKRKIISVEGIFAEII